MAARNKKTGHKSGLNAVEQATLAVLSPSHNRHKMPKSIAVALSGGGDSMALVHCLAQWALQRGITVHALTVDHGLRPASKAEAQWVQGQVQGWHIPNLKHEILAWKGRKPSSRIQEAAREARYKLLANYCDKNKIRHLFLAHHADDQAETILFRLAKGSGLDGLAGMGIATPYGGGLTLVRPCLGVTHDALISYCKQAKIEWVEDPSNHQDRFARVRLRQSADILAKEGLTSSRLAITAQRLARARQALERYTEKEEKKNIVIINTDSIEYKIKGLLALPEDIFVRILSRGIQHIGFKKNYAPRLEQIEALANQIRIQGTSFKGATLAGCVVKAHLKKNTLSIQREQGASKK